MERFKRFSLVALSLMLVLTLVTVVGTKPVHALVASMVQVVNDAAHPVPVTGAVRNLENPARTPFHFRCVGSIYDGVNSKDCDLVVPAGQRLVVENIHGLVLMPSGQKVVVSFNSVSVPGGDSPIDAAILPAVLQGQLFGIDYYGLNQPTRFYINHTATTDGMVQIIRYPNAGTARVDIHVIGYLIALL